MGILVGTVYTLFFVPKVFDSNPEEWGLIQLLLSYVMLFMPFALVGVPNSIIKFWPEYSNKYKHEFSFFVLSLISIGLIVVSVILFIFREFVFFSSSSSNTLMEKYYLYFFICFFVHTVFYFFLNFARVYCKTSFPTFLKDTFIKIWTFLLLTVYWLDLISFDYFFKAYILGFLLQMFILYIYIKRNTNLVFTVNTSFLKNNAHSRKILNYGFYSLLTGGAAVLVSRIDILMINKYIDLSSVAFYSVALFFITVLQVPVRSLATISAPILSEHLGNNNMSGVNSIYRKTALNMFLVSSFILISILLNIDEFMTILGEKFGQVKYVILILGIARLYEIINSSNGTIIILSKYYRYDMVFQVILLALTVITNIILIPLYGINGAALATGITIVLSSSIKGLFVYSKYQLHPYSKGTLKILLVILVCIASTLFIPEIMNVYVTMVIKTSIISVIYLVALFALEISDDLKQLIKSYL